MSNSLGVKEIYQNREKSTKRLDDIFPLIPFPPFFLFLGDQKIESETKTKQSHVLSSVACNNNTTPLAKIKQDQLKKHVKKTSEKKTSAIWDSAAKIVLLNIFLLDGNNSSLSRSRIRNC